MRLPIRAHSWLRLDGQRLSEGDGPGRTGVLAPFPKQPTPQVDLLLGSHAEVSESGNNLWGEEPVGNEAVQNETSSAEVEQVLAWFQVRKQVKSMSCRATPIQFVIRQLPEFVAVPHRVAGGLGSCRHYLTDL